MRQPQWNPEAMKWDAHRAFYMDVQFGRHVWYAAPIKLFETGELVLMWGNYRPDWRGKSEALNIGIWSTKDSKAPRLYDDDGPIPVCALNRKGQQLIVVDYDSHAVVAIDSFCKTAPYKGSAYFPPGSSVPIGVPIKSYGTVKPDKAQRRHIKGIVAACHTWYEMADEEGQKLFKVSAEYDVGLYFDNQLRHDKKGRNYGYSDYYYHVRSDDVVNTEFKDLPPQIRRRIVRWGIHPSYQRIEHSNVHIKP